MLRIHLQWYLPTKTMSDCKRESARIDLRGALSALVFSLLRWLTQSLSQTMSLPFANAKLKLLRLASLPISPTTSPQDTNQPLTRNHKSATTNRINTNNTSLSISSKSASSRSTLSSPASPVPPPTHHDPTGNGFRNPWPSAVNQPSNSLLNSIFTNGIPLELARKPNPNSSLRPTSCVPAQLDLYDGFLPQDWKTRRSTKLIATWLGHAVSLLSPPTFPLGSWLTWGGYSKLNIFLPTGLFGSIALRFTSCPFPPALSSPLWSDLFSEGRSVCVHGSEATDWSTLSNSWSTTSRCLLHLSFSVSHSRDLNPNWDLDIKVTSSLVIIIAAMIIWITRLSKSSSNSNLIWSSTFR